MKQILLTSILILALSNIQSDAQKLIDVVRFASIEKSRMLLAQEDDFTDSWSPLDIDIRMQKPNSSKDELLEFIPTQARTWNTKEIALLKSLLEKIDDEIAKEAYHLNLPDTIYFIKTTLDEEFKGASGYTRMNYVILNGEKVKASNPMLDHLIIHELFHALSRHDPVFRSEMYALIGFKMMNEIELSDELQARKLTNPDAPYLDSYISLQHKEEEFDCTMLNFSNKTYREGSVMEYINIGFLKLSGDKEKKVVYNNGQAVIYSVKEVSGFFEQVGNNTNYIIHPEEILAENFTHLLLNTKDLPNPEVVNKIKQLLKE